MTESSKASHAKQPSSQATLATREQAPSPGGPLARFESASPFSFMHRFISDMDSLFGDFGFGAPLLSRSGTRAAAWSPQMDVTTRDGQLFIHADLPGLKQDQVKINVAENVLTISGERVDHHESERGGIQRRERSYGSFLRQIALPEGVDPESIKASFENGELEVTMPMPKASTPQGRVIPIQTKPTSGPDVH